MGRSTVLGRGLKGASGCGNQRSARRRGGKTEMTEKRAELVSKGSGGSGVVMLIAMAIAGAAAITAPLAVSAKDTELNVYNWSDYIAKDTIPNFEKQTGVKVKYDNYDSDDTLQAKLLTGNSGYDIVVPPSTTAARRIGPGISAPLAKPKPPNLKSPDPD